jgi:hypothetical protein
LLFVGLLLWGGVLVAVKLNWESLSRKTPEQQLLFRDTA